jgi:hypothetical protein
MPNDSGGEEKRGHRAPKTGNGRRPTTQPIQTPPTPPGGGGGVSTPKKQH